MKKLFLLSTFYFLLSTSFSQEQFNRVYENEEYPFIKSIQITSDTGYVSIGGYYFNSNMRININFFDTLSVHKWSKYYGEDNYNSYAGSENACIKTDGGYILSGSSHYSGQDTNFIYIIKFDENFDTLWTRKHFIDTNWVVARGICNTDDGGFMVVGETELKSDSTMGDGHNYGLMLKLDANANYEWFKSFGTDNNTDVLYKVVQTPDGGYLVGGATESWQDALDPIDKGDWYVIKTDASGNEEWYRRYGSPQYDDGRMGRILQTRDTSYYLIGAWTWGRNSTGSALYKESYIIKLDQNFNEVYELKYDNQAFERSYPIDAIELEDSNLAFLGHKLTDNEAPRATLHKITPEGEILWQRQYVAINDTIDTQSYGLSIKQTSDGGFIFGGYASSPDLSPNHQMWLVKTDSLGCDGTGDFWDCSTGVMVNEYVDNPTFEMYPNPANDNLFITCHFDPIRQAQGRLCGEISAQTVEIYDLTGKIVKQTSLRGTKQSVQIGDLEKGVYIVRVGKQTKKLIIE